MNDKRQKLLMAILAQIPREGWTARALAQGAAQAGVMESAARRVFPRGIEDVVLAFADKIDADMRAAITADRKFAARRTRDKIAFAVWARLRAAEPHRDALRRLGIWAMMPRHMRAGGDMMWRAADAVWRAAGDASTDYNYYTKRLLLIAVMKSTLAFWFNDASPGYRDSYAFLERRIADVLAVGKGIAAVKAVGVEDVMSMARASLRARWKF
ncbi:MAG: COQ9 family protein [Alphaproteobacteria bacterium]|nr:COQ9 family protein [Alphaproteobacteria bacterium]